MKNAKMMNMGSFEDELMDFAMYEGHFSLALSKEYANCVPVVLVVAAIQTEVREHLLLLGLNPDLGIAEDHEVFVIDCGLLVFFEGVVAFAIVEGHNDAVLIGGRLGLEASFEIGSDIIIILFSFALLNLCLVPQLDYQDDLLFVVDVLVNVNLI